MAGAQRGNPQASIFANHNLGRDDSFVSSRTQYSERSIELVVIPQKGLTHKEDSSCKTFTCQAMAFVALVHAACEDGHGTDAERWFQVQHRKL